MPPAPRPPPAERSTAARNSAIASIVVITTRPRLRLADLPLCYAVRRFAPSQVSADSRKRTGAAYPVRVHIHIAMNDFSGESALRERLLHRLREHDGAVPPARAAESNGQITLSLTDVVRDQISEQAFDAAQEFPGLRKRADIPPHFRVFARERPQSRHEMMIGQQPYVEDQVRIRRHSVAVSETHDRNQHRALVRILESRRDEVAQFMHVELRGFNDHIRKLADGLHQRAFVRQTFPYGKILSQRMRSPGFAVSPQEGVLVRFDEN